MTEISTETTDALVDLLFEDSTVRSWEKMLTGGVAQNELLEAIDRHCREAGARASFPETVSVSPESDQTMRQDIEEKISPVGGNFLGEMAEVGGTFDYIISKVPEITWEELSTEDRREYATRFGTLTMEDQAIDATTLYLEQSIRYLEEDGRAVIVADSVPTQGDENLEEGHPLYHQIEEIVPVGSTDLDGSETDEVLISVTGRPPSSTEAPFRYSPTVAESNLLTRHTGGNPYTASALMTETLEGYGADEPSSEVFFDMHKKGYDAAPVYSDQTTQSGPIGFVSRQSLRSSSEERIGDQLQEFDNHTLIGEETHIEEILGALAGQRFVFVGESDELSGIVTRFDLNRLPVYLYLYDCFSEFEIGLRNLIREALPEWEDRTGVHVQSRSNGELLSDELAGAELGTLIEIVEEGGIEKSIRENLTGYETSLGDLKLLRNAVAHYNPIVHTMSGYSTRNSETRGAYQLYREYEFLQTCIRALHD